MRYESLIKLVTSIVIISLSVSYTCAQRRVISDTLSWKNIISLENDENKVKNILSFENYFQNNDNFLPVYRKKIEIPEQHSIKNLKIVHQKFEKITEIDNNLLTDVDKIQEQLDIHYGISIFRKKYYAVIEFIPLRKNNFDGNVEKLVEFEIQFELEPENIPKTTRNFVQNSKLNAGKWYKIKIQEKGIYKLTYEQLKEMGFSNFNNIGVFGYGYMVPKANSESYYDDLPERNIVKVDANSDGVFNAGDYILFYAEGPNKIWYDKTANVYKHETHDYSEYAYYFVSDQGTWREASGAISELNYDVAVNAYDEVRVLEKDSLNLMNMGRRWFWRHFDFYTTHNFSVNFANLISSEPIKFNINLVARSTISSSFNIYINNVLTNSVNIENVSSATNGPYAKERVAEFQTLSNSQNVNIKIDYNKTTSVSEGWLDYIRIVARCNLKMNSDFLAFSDSKSIADGKNAQFKISNTKSNTKVWDISDPINALNINVTNSSNETKFNRSVSELKEYIVFNVNSSHPSPIINDYDLGMVKNQNLHALSNIDYVIITYPDFKAQAEQLAKLHQKNSGLSTAVVELDKVYNEFSSGCPDVSAIRNFMKMFYERANNDSEIPENLLLFGDGSFDTRAAMGKNGNYVITYQAYNSFYPSGAYVNDDFYVMLDPNEGLMGGYDNMDIGVGRIPVKTVAEAQNVVNKVNAYMSNSHFGSWRNIVCFVADDADDSTMHQEDSKTLGDKVMSLHPNFNVDRIFLDAYERVSTVMGMRYPEVNKIIDDRINSGCLLFNYTGHGNTKTLAHEVVVDLSQVNSWSNINNLPIFVTATCEYSRYDNYSLVSAGEQVLLNPNGGGIALFTTTRLAQAHSNRTLNMALLDYFFMRDVNQKALSMGHILMNAKNLIGNDANKNVFALIGDPALRPAIPQYDIVTESINGINVNEFIDTVGAKGKVIIKGYVRDNLGNKMTDFNGLVFPTVYDKKMNYVTRGNSGKPPLDYVEQMNVLFRGQTSVKNGEFEFSFIVPVDIAYFYGNGKISYYAHNYSFDANGHNFDMIIGGTSDNPVVDNEGPEIQLFMNNDEFIAGGITDENPILLAYVSDSSGINTVGSGIGHDITAIIDEDTQKAMVLNDFYEADLDNYISGKITYPLSNLTIGPHSIKLKVWDILNNSSEAFTDFIVANSSELIIDQIFNYPNPFSTNTDFYFSHNQANLPLDVLIQVFTITGKLVTSIEASVMSDGFRSHPIKWNALDDYGDKLGKGVYIYKIQVRSPNGNIASKIEKLFILN